MGFHDEDDFLINDKIGPFIGLLIGLIFISIIIEMIYSDFDKKDTMKIFLFDLGKSELFIEEESKMFFEKSKLNQFSINNDHDKYVDTESYYRFGLINRSDTVFYKLCLSRSNKNDFYLMKESSERVFGKYTIK